MSYPPVSSNTLLTYVLDTLPDPLQVSPAQGDIVYGALTFSISNLSGKPVSVSQIQFSLPVGPDSGELTKDPYAVLCGTNPAGFWDIVMTDSGVYMATPSSGNPISITNNGIIMQLYNIPVNQQTGSINLTVTETATDDTSPAIARTAKFLVAKFPYGFFFRNFTPDAAQIPVNGTVTLTWEGSEQATFKMTYGDTTVPVSRQRTWTSPPLTGDTTFLLTATVTYLGQTVTTSLTTTVIVANPDINASSILVTGPATFQSQTIVNGNLKANQGITVGGTAQLNNNLQVGGTTTLASLTVNQQLSAGGGINTSQLNASGITINGNGTVTGQLAIGNLKAMGHAVTIKSTTSSWSASFTAGCDGLVVAFLSPIPDITNWSACQAFGTCNGLSVSAQGGSSCLYSNSTVVNWNATSSFVLPVPSGSSFSLSAYFPNNTPLFPTIYFYWVPFGSGGITQYSDKAEHPEYIMEAMRQDPVSPNDRDYHAPAIRRLVGVMSEILGEKMNTEMKEKLREAIRDLVH